MAIGKKAGSKYLAPALILVWIIIIVGIVAAVTLFYSSKTDVMAEEADFLAKRIADCLVEDDYLREEFFNDFDIFEKCSLDEEIVDKSGLFYIGIFVSDFESEKVLKDVEKGVRDFKMQCSYKTEEEHLAGCSEKIIYALNQSDNSQKFLIKIIAGSNQLGRAL